MTDDDEIYCCEETIIGMCDSKEANSPYEHVCDLYLGHSGRHWCECGRNWDEVDREKTRIERTGQ